MKNFIKLIQEYPDFSIKENKLAKQEEYKTTGRPFKGSARWHSKKKDRFLVILNPSDKQEEIHVVEFNISDLLHAEHDSTLVSEDGETVSIYTFWIKKGSTGIEMKPFMV